MPDDRTIVVERFRDEIGDWRVCVLTPFGARVHAPWAIAVRARLDERLGLPVEVMWADDGIVLRLPEAADEVPIEELLISPEEIDDVVVSTLPTSSLFASRFRECAARSLLLPRRRPGERTPLWQQRQRSADLLAVASKHPSFPVLLETTRECLQDVFDVPALKWVLTELRARTIRMVSVDTPKASPFAQSLLFGWIAQYMYEYDSPLAERRAAALSLDRDLLRDLMGAEELRELIDPGVLADLELDLQRLSPRRQARDLDEVHDLLRLLGDLSFEEIAARCAPGVDVAALLGELVSARRAIEVRIGGSQRFADANDAGRLRDGLGVAIPLGLPVACTEPAPHALEELVTRYAASHGPFLPGAPAARFDVPLERMRSVLSGLVTAGRVVHGEFRPDGAEREVVRRRGVASAAAPIACLVAPRGRTRRGGRVRTLRDGLAGHPDGATTRRRRAGRGARSAAGRADHRQRARARRPSRSLARLLAGPPRCALHVRRRRLGGVGGDRHRRWARAAVLPRPGPPALDGRLRPRPTVGPDPRQPSRPSRGAAALRSGPSCRAADTSSTEPELLAALWDLVWAGEVTNDSLAPLRALVAGKPRRTAPKARPRPGRLTRIGPPAGAGRWSLVAPLAQPAASPTEAAHALALQLLERNGVLTRESVLAEGVEGGFAGIYPVLKALEERGHARRGYFVAGLGAAQFALPGAVDRLRAEREVGEGAAAVVLAATDPAQVYGGALPWPESAGRPARAAGSLVVVVDGEAAAYLDRGGRGLLTFPAAAEDDRWIDALAAIVKDGRARSLELQKIDGEPAIPSTLAPRLRAVGFVDGYRGLVLRP